MTPTNDPRNLREHLEILNQRNKNELIQNLAERKRKELEFHNRDRDKNFTNQLSTDTYGKLHGNKKFYNTVQLSVQYVDGWIKENSKGKIFLDYACGNGFNAIKSAKAGAELAIYELRRIMKPGGKILAVEALDYNPIIKLYRSITPQIRTDWEKAHILSYKDLIFARRFFEVKEVKHWHFFSIAGVYFPALLPLFNSIDHFFMNVPLLKMMSWMFTFELHKRRS